MFKHLCREQVRFYAVVSGQRTFENYEKPFVQGILRRTCGYRTGKIILVSALGAGLMKANPVTPAIHKILFVFVLSFVIRKYYCIPRLHPNRDFLE